jgi:hypothetical protein
MSNLPDFIHRTDADGNPTHLACPRCSAEWEVSEEDPDSTLSDALNHAMRHTEEEP